MPDLGDTDSGLLYHRLFQYSSDNTEGTLTNCSIFGQAPPLSDHSVLTQPIDFSTFKEMMPCLVFPTSGISENAGCCPIGHSLVIHTSRLTGEY